MTQLKYLLATIGLLAYEGEGDPPPPADDSGAQGGGDAPKMISLEEHQKALQTEQKKQREATQKALAELEALRPKLNMTKQERDELDTRIKDLQKELLTKEEIAEQERNRLRKAHDSKVSELTSERDAWQQRYTNSFIERSITDAAVKADVYNPSQVVTLLRQSTRLQPRLDAEGNPTDKFETRVSFDDVDNNGKPVTLELTPEDALKRMREKDEFLNLFRGTGVGGVGGNTQRPGKKSSARELARNPEEYRKARANGDITF